MRLADLQTPALVIDAAALDRNLATMAEAHPGRRLRPHVKAHKCTALAAAQLAQGHPAFTCATPRELVGLARAGVGDDILLANESLDLDRLRQIAALDLLATVAIDSAETLSAAVTAGIRSCVVDVNVGLPRCGVTPAAAGRLADQARRHGVDVRGVMGYEGHVMMVTDGAVRRARVERAMELLLAAHHDVGGAMISAGGTGTYDLHQATGVNEIQAGSYALMDSHYATLEVPFEQALHVIGTVISVSGDWAVADVGLKALGMDHGNPSIAGAEVRFCSDEHVTFAPAVPMRPGDRVAVVPGHVDPTMAMHDAAWILGGGTEVGAVSTGELGAIEVIDRWPIDLRGW